MLRQIHLRNSSCSHVKSNVEIHVCAFPDDDSLPLYEKDEYAQQRFLYSSQFGYILLDEPPVSAGTHNCFQNVSYKSPFPVIGSLINYEKDRRIV